MNEHYGKAKTNVVFLDYSFTFACPLPTANASFNQSEKIGTHTVYMVYVAW